MVDFMANRWKKNGAQARETVIEGEYKRRYAPDDPLDMHRRRWYGDPVYRERHGGGPQPARPVQPVRRWTVPLDPRDAERLRKLADRDKLEKKIARGLFRATRVVNPLARAHSIYKTFEPILKDIRFDFDDGFSFSRNPGGIQFYGPVASQMELKCSNPLVPIDYFGGYSGHNNATTCGLAGQAGPWYQSMPPDVNASTFANTNATWIFSHLYYVGGVVGRLQYSSVYWQRYKAGLSMAGSGARIWTHRATPDFNAMPDPNYLRASPGASTEPPVLRIADPVQDYVEALDAASASNPRVAVKITSGGSGGGGGLTISPSKPGGPRPPKPRQRERKALGTMRTVLTVLDHASEAAEVVDAIYEALPAKTREKWSCGGGRGLIDSAGQYGIDKADCKLRALWHNWHKVDIEKAVKNIIANEIQDRVIGNIARASPNNVGRATDDAQKKINELLERLFEAVGLKDNEERN